MRTTLVLAAGALVGLSTAACIVPGGPPPGSFTQLEQEAASGINDTERGAERVLLPDLGGAGVNRLQGTLVHREGSPDVDRWSLITHGQHLEVDCTDATDSVIRVEIFDPLVPDDEQIVSALSCEQGNTTQTAFSESGRFQIYVYADPAEGTDHYLLGVREVEP
jgi:hypothetical protein